MNYEQMSRMLESKGTSSLTFPDISLPTPFVICATKIASSDDNELWNIIAVSRSSPATFAARTLAELVRPICLR